METDLDAIARQRNRWIRAIRNGSAVDFIAVVTDDAVWLPSGRTAIVGRDALEAFLEDPFAEFDYEYDVTDVRVRVAGEHAVEQARFRSRVTTRTGEDLPVHQGRYTLIWRKDADGEWRIERYIDLTAEFVEEE